MSRTVLLAGVAAALLSAVPAAAQSSPDTAASPATDDIAAAMGKDSVTVAAGPALVPDYDGSNTYRVVPAPLVVGTYKGIGFSVVGNRASIDLIRQKPGPVYNLEVGPVGVVNFNRTSVSNIADPRVKLLPQLRTGIELGGYVGISKTGVVTSPYDKLTFSVSYRHDVNGAGGGDTLEPSLTYLTPLSTKAAIGLIGYADRVNDRYARYHYTVTPQDAAVSGLPAYAARGDAWNSYTVGGFGTYALTGNLLHGLKVIAGGTYSRNLNTAAETPLTRIAGSPNQWIGAAGLAYTF